MSFRIIPVLDLKGGEVVRARAGDRASYRPLVSPLCEGSRPADVLRGLLGLAGFHTIYVADLDAIAGTGQHRRQIQSLVESAPGVEIWLDAGFRTAADAQRWGARPSVRPVFGSESLESEHVLEEAVRAMGNDGFVLSLDYRAGTFIGPSTVEHGAELWPDHLILMTLDRVGSGAGPDMARLAALIGEAGRAHSVFAAGGVRDAADLARLGALGVAGALVASALHDGRLPPAELIRFQGRNASTRRGGR